MKLEDASPEMQAFADRLFTLVEQLAGARPEPYASNGWYTGYIGDAPFVGFKPVGRARKYQPNSLLVRSKWHNSLWEGPVYKTDDWWGQTAVTLSARPENAKEMALAERFVRQAYQLHRSSR